MGRHNKKGRTEQKDKFVALRLGLRESEAWRSLNFSARAVYIEMIAGVHPGNNGRVARSVRFLSDIVPAACSTIESAIKQLDERGFIVRTQRGTLGVDGHGQASLWRFTELGTAAAPRPTKDYLNWNPDALEKQNPVPKIVTLRPENQDTAERTAPKFRTGCPESQDANDASGPITVPKIRTNLIYQVGQASIVPDISNATAVSECPLLVGTYSCRC